MTTADVARTRERTDGSRRDREIVDRLRKASGQLNGIATMHEQRRYCIDILDQLSAVNAAVDAVALMLLEDHVHNCVAAAVQQGDTEDTMTELVAAVRRYVRSR
jgi:DNA-binding FrmR family transcriptional regulator